MKKLKILIISMLFIIGLSNYCIANTLTISAWIKVSTISTASDLPICGKRQAGTAKDGYMLYQYEDDIRFRIDDADYAEATASLTAGTWYFIVGTFDGTTATVYVNGIAGATTDTGTITNTNYAMRVGYDMTNYFAGSVDESRLYGRCLTAAEVLALYNSQL